MVDNFEVIIDGYEPCVSDSNSSSMIIFLLPTILQQVVTILQGGSFKKSQSFLALFSS